MAEMYDYAKVIDELEKTIKEVSSVNYGVYNGVSNLFLVSMNVSV